VFFKVGYEVYVNNNFRTRLG